MVRTDRAEDLAARVEMLLEDVALSSAMGLRARTRCETSFSLGATARLWHALVEQLVSKPPGG